MRRVSPNRTRPANHTQPHFVLIGPNSLKEQIVRTLDCLPPGCALLSQKDQGRTEESDLHRHPHGEIYVVQAGHLVSASGDARWLIPAGQAYWLPPGTPHGGTLCGAYGIRVYLAAEIALEFCPASPTAFSATPLLEALMDRWSSEAASGLPDRPIDRHRVAVLSEEIARSMTRPLILPMPSHAVMRTVVSDWATKCEERLSLDELADRCRMSRRTFTRQFRVETGLSPGAWMQSARILRGCDLMASGMAVTETAYMLGYESPSSFFNLCRKMTGLNPSELLRSVDRRAR